MATNPISGSYRSSEIDSPILELRIDVDSPSPYWPVLNTVSGDLKEGGAITSFQVQQLREKQVTADSFFLYCTATLYKGFQDDGYGARIKIEGSLTGNKWIATVTIQEPKKNEQRFICQKYSQYFRHVNVDIDYCGDYLALPEFDTHSLPSRPFDLPRRTITCFTPFEDAGIQMEWNKDNSSEVVDPDPTNPWTISELYECMDIHQAVRPQDWNLWILLATQYRDPRLAGLMFDKKERKGCVVFTDHIWHKDVNSSNPTKRAMAVRKLIHSIVHEMGHAFNLPHPFDLNLTNSTSFMNYDWRYNIRNGPNSYFKNFCYKFDEREVRMMRHGRQVFVRPGASAWQAQIRVRDAPTILDDNRFTKRLKLLITSDKAKYQQMQVVSVEVKLKNVHQTPVFVDTRLDLGTDTVKFFLTNPSGRTLEIDPVATEYGIDGMRLLYQSGSSEGPDSHTEVVRIFYGKDGFYFKQPGKYILKAVYQHADFYIVSNTVSILVEPFHGDSSILGQFFTDNLGEYVALGGPNSAKYQTSKQLLDRLIKSDEHKTWIGTIQYLTAENSIKKSRDFTKDLSQHTIQVKTKQPEEKSIINRSQSLYEQLQLDGSKRDNFLYQEVVMLRARAYVALYQIPNAEKEIFKMLGTLKARGVKPFVLNKLQEEWLSIKGEPARAPKGLQERLKEILNWRADYFTEEDEKDETSGLSHFDMFSPFNHTHLELSAQCIRLIVDKAEESQDVAMVLEFVDALQKSNKYNHTLLQYSLEIFIQHHPLAREARLRVPEITEPSEMDESTYAMVPPVGPPQEIWIDYWRNDADFCYHHQHWHNVYRARGLPGFVAPHLDRQGELFAYMHQQMLARYDAERESWGLDPVVPYRFSEVEPLGCDIGEEFHADPRYSRMKPRPPGQQWAPEKVSDFQNYHDNLMLAIEKGKIVGPQGLEINLREKEDPSDKNYNPQKCSPNWWGHIIEATSGAFYETYGSMHNSGHGVFGSIGQEGRNSSYMMSTSTAVRDMIFFRWHKYIDTLIDAFLKTRLTEVATDAPKIVISASDIIISPEPNPPMGFDEWMPGGWANQYTPEHTLKTTLGKPVKKFEWGKLTHEVFQYHIRLRRKTYTDIGSDLKLTLRIFICPTKCMNDRRRWIEMDKFHHILPAGQTHSVLTRKDIHSSVIRRDDELAEDDIEKPVTDTVPGFCECGWPYTMLLPRGTAEGEDYSLLVCVTDNTIDVHEIRSKCGSLSYCGVRDNKYPDRRYMGYPFTTPITVNGERKSISEAVGLLDNMAISQFKIQNTDTRFPPPRPPTPPPEPLPDITTVAWTSGDQLGLPMEKELLTYRRSRWTGRVRVLVDGDACVATNSAAPKAYVKLRFQGRPKTNYIIKNITIAERLRDTLNVKTDTENKPTSLTIKGQPKAEIPPAGLETDPAEFVLESSKDYFVTFELETPGCYASGVAFVATTWWIPEPTDKAVDGLNWDEYEIFDQVERQLASIYCLERICINEPDVDEDVGEPVTLREMVEESL